MAARLARTLKATDDLKPIAKLLQSKGRGRDTVLAHITKEEAAMLKARGGSGTINPDTGLPEFETGQFGPYDYTPSVDLSSYSFYTPTIDMSTYTPTSAVDMGAYQIAPYESIASFYQPNQPVDMSYYGYNPYMNTGTIEPALTSMYTPQLPTYASAFEQPSSADIYAGQYYGGGPTMTTPTAAAELGAPAAAPEAALTAEAPAAAPTTAAEQKGLLSTLLSGGSPTADQWTKLLLGLGVGGLGYLQQQRAAGDVSKAQQQYLANAQAAARSLQESVASQRGPAQMALSQAVQGRLSDAQLRAYRAAQARLAQAASRTGGVGAVQTEAGLQEIYQQALANQQEMAMRLMSATDPTIAAAIQAELQGQQGSLQLGLDLSNRLQQAQQYFWGNLAKAFA